MLSELAIFSRLLLATALGGLVGWERESSSRPAGFRTNILVCVGSALIMIVSLEVAKVTRTADPARIAAQVVSGIGFLGAGTIIREGFAVKGLTTAASLWTVAGVGLAAGAGFYFSAVAATLLVIVTLTIFNTLTTLIAKESGLKSLRVKVFDQPGEVGKIGSVLGNYDVHIIDVSIDHIRNEPNIYVNLQVRVPPDLNQNELTQHLAQTTGVIQVEWKGN